MRPQLKLFPFGFRCMTLNGVCVLLLYYIVYCTERESVNIKERNVRVGWFQSFFFFFCIYMCTHCVWIFVDTDVWANFLNETIFLHFLLSRNLLMGT